MQEPSYPSAQPPERTWTIESMGSRLNLIEWGDPDAQPLLLVHGMWDHARSFGVLGPLLASNFRVIALDARGHGDSGWADAYTWECDVQDVVNVLRTIGRPTNLVGHSKGGGEVTDAAIAVPDLVTKVVNIDGLGPPPLREEDVPGPRGFAKFLDARRRIARRNDWRAYPDMDSLVERRRAQNPRLSTEWLRYFVFHGARRTEAGWRWKSDPHMNHGYGPWQPDWVEFSYAAIRAPVLAIVGSARDTWGPLPEPILARRLARFRNVTRVTIPGAGHFIHVEFPAETARAILDYLRS